MAAPVGRLAVQNYRLISEDLAAHRCNIVPTDLVEITADNPVAVDPLNPVHDVRNPREWNQRAVTPARLLAALRFLRGVFGGAMQLRRDRTVATNRCTESCAGVAAANLSIRVQQGMELYIFARFHAKAGQEDQLAASLTEVLGPTRQEARLPQLAISARCATRRSSTCIRGPRSRPRGPAAACACAAAGNVVGAACATDPPAKSPAPSSTASRSMIRAGSGRRSAASSRSGEGQAGHQARRSSASS